MKCFFCDELASFQCNCRRFSCATHTYDVGCWGCFDAWMTSLTAKDQAREQERLKKAWCDFCNAPAKDLRETHHCAKCMERFCAAHGQYIRYEGKYHEHWDIVRCKNHLRVADKLGYYSEKAGWFPSLLMPDHHGFY